MEHGETTESCKKAFTVKGTWQRGLWRKQEVVFKALCFEVGRCLVLWLPEEC